MGNSRRPLPTGAARAALLVLTVLLSVFGCDHGSSISGSPRAAGRLFWPPLGVGDFVAVCPSYDASRLPAPLAQSSTAAAGTSSGSFAVSDEGQATYAMPIVVPPGRLGMEPKLALAYDSSRGEGPLGVGFGLQGLSSISRCPSNLAQDGEIRAVRYDSGDKFCLDGLRLVPFPRGNNGEWRTFPDTMRRVVSHVQDRALGPQSWTVYERDGRIREYGTTPDSQALATGGVVGGWWLARERDRHDNAIDYVYENDKWWQDGHTQEILVSHIDYTTNASTPPTRRIGFTYEATPPSVLFLGGLSIVKSHVLSRIDVTTLPSAARVRAYHLDYGVGQATSRRVLRSVSECAADGTCKPATRFTWTDNPPGFTRTSRTQVMIPRSARGDYKDTGDTSPGKWTLADVNGDGLDDLVVVYPSGEGSQNDKWTVALNVGGSFGPPEVWATLPHPKSLTADTGSACSLYEDNWVLTPMDYDQDGITDILLDTANPDPSSWPAYAWLRSVPSAPLGHRFELKSTAVPQPPGISLSYAELTSGVGCTAARSFPSHVRFARVGDVNGDGVGDLIECSNPTWADYGYSPTEGTPIWSVHLWKPNLPGGPGWDPNPIPIPQASTFDCSWGFTKFHVVDLDGDGVSELVAPGPGAMTYAALHLDSNDHWQEIPTGLPSQYSSALYGTRRLHWLDANGDGLADALYTGLSTECLPGDIDCQLPYFQQQPCAGELKSWYTCPNDVPYLAANEGKESFSGQAPTLLQSPLGQPMTDWWGDQGIALDYNGDGRTDFMLPVAGMCPDQGPEACWFIIQSSSAVAGFSAAPKAQPSSGAGAPILTDIHAKIETDTTGFVHTWYNPQVTDVNGDGRHDLVQPTFDGNGTFTVFTNSGPQDLLVAITDGMNALDPGDPGFVPTVAIKYGSLVDESITQQMGPGPAREQQTYLKAWDPKNTCEYPRSCVVGSGRVVQSYALNDGQNEPRTFSVKYRDGRYHRLGRGMLGFGERIVVDEDTGAGRAEFFDNRTWDDTLHVYPFAGQVDEAWTWGTAAAQPSSKPTQIELAYETDTLRQVPTDPTTYFTLAVGIERLHKEGTFDPKGSETLQDYVRNAKDKGATVLGETLTVVSSFDPTFGDVLQQDTIAKGADFHESVTRNVENDTGHWLLGEAKYEESCSQALGTTQCRTTSRTFDGYGDVKESVAGDPLDPDTQLTTSYYRDKFGNLTLTTAYDQAGHYRSACTSYEPEGIFPYATANQLGHTALFAYDTGLGVLTGSVDPNGLPAHFRHDGFGRLTEEHHPDGSFATYALSREKKGGPSGDWWALEVKTAIGGGPVSTVELDSLGRPVHAWAHVAGTQSCDGSNCASVLRLDQEMTYDHLGRVEKVTVPWMEGDSLTNQMADTYEHDAIGRVTEHVEPWGRKTTYTYGDNKVTATDWLGPTTREVDALGRTVKTTDKAKGTVETKYGPFSLPHTVERFGTETTTTIRDAYGRVVEEDDADRGKTVTHYDGFGEVLSVDDAATRHFAFSYDEIGRLIERDDTVNGEMSSTTWAYDSAPHGVGMIAQVTSPDGHVDAYTYTHLSQPQTHTLTFGDTGESFSSTLSYDKLGRVLVVEYPVVPAVGYPHPARVAPLAVRREHDDFGNVVALRDDATAATYWKLEELDGAGRPTKEVLGNGITVRHAYAHESGVVQHVDADGPGFPHTPPLQSLAYEYDAGLRMTSRTDELQKGVAGPLSEGFGYDAIDRLTCVRPGGWPASGSRTPYEVCPGPIDYAPNGNIKTKDGLAYAYDPAHPHAVKTVGAASYQHDAVGNQIERPGATIAYTPFDLPESYTFTGDANVVQPIATTQLVYDGRQHRIRKTLLTPAGATLRETEYLDDLYERVRDESGERHLFYVGAGSATVVLTRAAGGSDQVAYALSDALGSVDVITDGGGKVIENRSYDAFGARRDPVGWGAWQGPLASGVTPVGFEGLEADDEVGLVNMRGRIYDPKIGRFLTTDPIVSHPGFGQSWNPYSYVLNSPLNLRDPSGFDTGSYLSDSGKTETISETVIKGTRPPGAAGPAGAASGAGSRDAGADDTPAGSRPASTDPPRTPTGDPPANQGEARGEEHAEGGSVAGDIAAGTARAVFKFAVGALNTVSKLNTGQFAREVAPVVAENAVRGWKDDGLLGAVAGGVNTLNPLYAIAKPGADAYVAAGQGDVRGVAEGVTAAGLALGAAVLGREVGGEAAAEGGVGTRVVTNSAGKPVIRTLVANADELLEAAEQAAGGSLDSFIEYKPNWWRSPDGTVRIEFNLEGHGPPINEGPHVTVRVFDGQRHSVVQKVFIEGQETLK